MAVACEAVDGDDIFDFDDAAARIVGLARDVVDLAYDVEAYCVEMDASGDEAYSSASGHTYFVGAALVDEDDFVVNAFEAFENVVALNRHLFPSFGLADFDVEADDALAVHQVVLADFEEACPSCVDYSDHSLLVDLHYYYYYYLNYCLYFHSLQFQHHY